MTEEEYILQQISDIQREYQKVIDPLIKRYATLQSLKPMPMLMVNPADLPKEVLGLLMKQAGVNLQENDHGT